jgi:hypothetical protein
MSCPIGYFGDNCDLTAESIVGELWITARVVQTVLLVVSLGSVVFTWYTTSYYPEDDNSDHINTLQRSASRVESTIGAILKESPISNSISNWVFMTLVVLNLVALIGISIDPMGYSGILPKALVDGLNGFILPLIIIILMIQTFHWIDMYLVSDHLNNQIIMITKINKSYKHNSSFETVKKQIGRMRIPLVVLIVVLLAAQFAYIVIISSDIPIAPAIGLAWQVIQFIWYISFMIVFRIYSKKFAKLIDQRDPLFDENEKAPIIMRYSVTFIIVWMCAIILISFVHNVYVFIAALVVCCIAIVGVTFITMSLYIDFGKIKHVFKRNSAGDISTNVEEVDTISVI